jgi:hypothetical protein
MTAGPAAKRAKPPERGGLPRQLTGCKQGFGFGGMQRGFSQTREAPFFRLKGVRTKHAYCRKRKSHR